MNVILTEFQKEYLDGLMLGDGNLHLSKNKDAAKNPFLSIVRNIKDIEYLRDNLKVFQNLCTENFKDVHQASIFDKRTNKNYYNCKFSTRYLPCLMPIYNRWYFNGKKIIPNDLKLTPLTCSIWFYDDGSLEKSKKNNGRLKLKLSSHSFTKEENLFLIKQMNELLSANFLIVNEKKHSYIVGADLATKKFINYIKPFLLSSMNRKHLWTEQDFEIKESLPQSKNREEFDLNEKEFKILDCLYQKNKSMKRIEICREINWIRHVSQKEIIPSGISRYFTKFIKNDILEKEILDKEEKIFLTEKGKELLGKYNEKKIKELL